MPARGAPGPHPSPDVDTETQEGPDSRCSPRTQPRPRPQLPDQHPAPRSRTCAHPGLEKQPQPHTELQGIGFHCFLGQHFSINAIPEKSPCRGKLIISGICSQTPVLVVVDPAPRRPSGPPQPHQRWLTLLPCPAHPGVLTSHLSPSLPKASPRGRLCSLVRSTLHPRAVPRQRWPRG